MSKYLEVCPGWVQMKPLKVGDKSNIGPPPEGKLWWSGDRPPPAVGDEIYVGMNNLKWGKVLGYGSDCGYLYVLVVFKYPPAWYIKQNGLNCAGAIFGCEINFDKEPA